MYQEKERGEEEGGESKQERRPERMAARSLYLCERAGDWRVARRMTTTRSRGRRRSPARNPQGPRLLYAGATTALNLFSNARQTKPKPWPCAIPRCRGVAQGL